MSHAYRRLLAGQLSAERYVAIVKRGVDMGMRRGRAERQFAQDVAMWKLVQDRTTE